MRDWPGVPSTLRCYTKYAQGRVSDGSPNTPLANALTKQSTWHFLPRPFKDYVRRRKLTNCPTSPVQSGLSLTVGDAAASALMLIPLRAKGRQANTFRAEHDGKLVVDPPLIAASRILYRKFKISGALGCQDRCGELYEAVCLTR